MTEALVDYSGVQPPSLKVYMGCRWTQHRNSVMVVTFRAGDVFNCPLRHLVHHSPTGMEWGYAGSGPADLALSILADHFGENPSKAELHRGEITVRCNCDEGRGDRGFDDGCDRCYGSGDVTQPLQCWTYHHPFKAAFCGRWGRSWAITSDQIDQWLAGLKGPGGRPCHTFTAAQAAVDPDEEAAQDRARDNQDAARDQEDLEF